MGKGERGILKNDLQGLVVEQENILNTFPESFCDIMRQFKRWIVFPLLQENNRFPPYPYLPGELILRKPESCPEFLDA